MSVRKLLWVSGILALIGVGIPQSVALGAYLLVIPGFMLALAPTVFMYTATFAFVRRYLPIPQTLVLNLVAAGITIGLGALVVLPMSLAGRWAFERAATGDVVPRDRIAIGGDVLLNNDETQAEYHDGKTEVPCNALCAALLDTPGVRTLTIAHKERPISYRLVSKSEANSNARTPKNPEHILRYLPEKRAAGGPIDHQAIVTANKTRENAITARWGLRVANDITLSVVPPPQHHDLTIAMTNTGPDGFHEIVVRQVEVRDREGRVLLRRQYVKAEPLFMPLLVFPYDPFGSAKWRVARKWLATKGGLLGVSSIAALFEGTTLARPESGDAVVADMRGRLTAALAQPGKPADLSLAASWLAAINWQYISDGDTELLGKLIADTRVIDLPGLYEGGPIPMRPELRSAVVARLINPTTLPQLRARLDTLVRYMAPGTFAASTPDELTLLSNPLLRMNASGLVQRLADQGQAAVPELVRILQEDVRVEPRKTREDVMAAVRWAFMRLGPDAASALPVVIELYDRGGTLLAYGSTEKAEWRIAMVLMGRPLEDVPFEPELTAEKIAQRRTDLMRNVKWARENPGWHL